MMPLPKKNYIFIGLFVYVIFLSWLSGAFAEEFDDIDHAENIWTCSMHPNIQLPDFGQCPICFMDLIEVPKDTGADKRTNLRQITFDERARNLAQVEVVEVVRGSGTEETRMVGKVDYDETRLGTITAWMSGRIDTLHVDYTGALIKKGQPMAEIYSPELLTAQAELIQSSAAVKDLKASTLEIIKNTTIRTELAAREKLRLLGLTDRQIANVIKRSKPADHITLTASMNGIVIHKNVSQGMYVKTGTPLFTIADIDHLWVNLGAYESDVAHIRHGQKVNFIVEAFPGYSFTGKVAYVDSLVDEKTRTIRVRLNVDNKNGKLKPGMFVRAQVKNTRLTENQPLLIPVSAPLFTGKRALVYVQLPDKKGVYVGKEIILGPRSGDYYQVRKGLSEGELVVSHGNFKIDSAIQIQARPSMMNPLSLPKSDGEDMPTLFLSKLNLLSQNFTELSDAVHEQNQQAVQQALTRFIDKLNNLRDNDLQGKDALAWKEMSMLLGSDAILVGESNDNKELDRIYAVMAEHFHHVRSHFSLAAAVDSSSVDGELQRQLGILLNHYFTLQQHLANDDLARAQTSRVEITEKAEDLITLLIDSQHEQAKPIAHDLQLAITNLKKSIGLDEIRAVFYILSQAINTAVVTLGASGTGPVYEQFCPMAFDNTGAFWLSTDEEINNPYFGAVMLNCGLVRKQLKE